MTDPRLTPRDVEGMRRALSDQMADLEAPVCLSYAQAQTILTLLADREMLLAPNPSLRMVFVRPQMWKQTQERLAELRAENERLRALADEVGTLMLAIDELAVHAEAAQIRVYHDGEVFVVPPDSVEGVADHVRKEARKIKGWSLYQRALDYDRHKEENERLRAVAEAVRAYRDLGHSRSPEMAAVLNRLREYDAWKAART